MVLTNYVLTKTKLCKMFKAILGEGSVWNLGGVFLL